MMICTRFPKIIGTSVVRVYSTISQFPWRISRFYSTAHFCKFCHLRSWLWMSDKQQHVSMLQQSSLRRSGTIANKAQNNKSAVAEELSRTQNKIIPGTSFSEEIESLNNTSLRSSKCLKNDTPVKSESLDHTHEFNKECDKSDPVKNRTLIELEVEILRLEGYEVPDTITPLQWDELLHEPYSPARMNYLRHLFLTQKYKKEKTKARELVLLEKEKIEELRQYGNRLFHENGHIRYELGCNTIFLEMETYTMNQFNHGRVFNAMMYGQQFVIDVSFDDHMDNMERQRCAKDIMMAVGLNRSHPDPFYLHICNGDREADTMKRLERLIPPMYKLEYPLSVHPESYLDYFPKEKIIYITPHCEEVMIAYDHDAVYVIGGIVKYGAKDKADYLKAERESIRMQKLPLHRYPTRSAGSKSLSINKVLGILLQLKHKGDWHHSLNDVPSRQTKTFENSQARLANEIKTRRFQTRAPMEFGSVSSARVKSLYEE